jgi:hypothetical protein
MWNGRPATWGTLTDATPQRVPVTHQAQASLGGASGSSPTYASCTRRRALCGCPLVLVVPERGAADGSRVRRVRAPDHGACLPPGVRWHSEGGTRNPCWGRAFRDTSGRRRPASSSLPIRAAARAFRSRFSSRAHVRWRRPRRGSSQALFLTGSASRDLQAGGSGTGTASTVRISRVGTCSGPSFRRWWG